MKCDMLIPEEGASFAGTGCRSAATVRIADEVGERLNVCPDCLDFLKSRYGTGITVVGEPQMNG